MRAKHLAPGVGLLLGLLFQPFAASAAQAEGPSADQVEYFNDLESELSQMGSSLLDEVLSATKTAQTGAETPAVITVVTGEEIRARGYVSLAEVLRTVPGFYDVYDGVLHNFGVRGINGGARAGGSGIKLMIDGLPVDYRPSTANFFGEELLPSLELLERVEVIRGPASSLYGANAFLGVVNLVTVTGKSAPGLRVTGEGALTRTHPGGGIALTEAAAGEGFDLLLSVGMHYRDRSGLTLPESSPALDDPSRNLQGRGATQGDLARPRSLFGKSTFKLWRGELSALATIQNLDAGGPLLDTGPLARRTRIAELNQNYRLTYRLEPAEGVSLSASGQYFNAAPTAQARLDIDDPAVLLVPSVGAEGFGGAFEAHVTRFRRLSLVMGADFVTEQHLLPTYDTLQIAGTATEHPGTLKPGEGHGARRDLDSLGVYGQALLSWSEAWHLALNGRADRHSLFGWNPSARVGLVWAAPRRPLSLKLLYGSSFKAPSAEQLFTRPAAFLDIQGNEKLQPQTAHTFELAGGWVFPGKRGELTLNLFATRVLGRVEFLQRSLFLESQIIEEEWVLGGELDARYGLTRSVFLRLAASVARTIDRSFTTLVLSTAEVTNPLFPPVQLHSGLDATLPWPGVRASAELSYIGPRSASQSNAVANTGAYQFPGYLYASAALSATSTSLLADRETRAALRVTNLLDTRWSDSGFAGVDVPAQGPAAYLTLTQAF